MREMTAAVVEMRELAEDSPVAAKSAVANTTVPGLGSVAARRRLTIKYTDYGMPEHVSGCQCQEGKGIKRVRKMK